MMNFVKVAAIEEIPAGKGKVVEVSGKTLALFRVAEEFYAIDNTCLHAGGSLGEGTLEGVVVSCPWHGWKYDVTTGANPMSSNMKVSCYAVKREGPDLYVQLSCDQE